MKVYQYNDIKKLNTALCNFKNNKDVVVDIKVIPNKDVGFNYFVLVEVNFNNRLTNTLNTENSIKKIVKKDPKDHGMKVLKKEGISDKKIRVKKVRKPKNEKVKISDTKKL